MVYSVHCTQILTADGPVFKFYIVEQSVSSLKMVFGRTEHQLIYLRLVCVRVFYFVFNCATQTLRVSRVKNDEFG